MIVLVGFMGAGKTTVGALIADRAGLPFVDVDEIIEAAAGTSVAEVFSTRGEAEFRAIEKEAVERALSGPPSVVAVGGGALGDPATCVALGWHDVVHLDVSYREAMRRIGHDPGRPMLAIADPRELYEHRRATYERVARHSVITDGRLPGEVADLVVTALGLSVTQEGGPIEVRLGDRSYQVHVETEAARDVTRWFALGGAARAFVITHPSLREAAKPVVDSLDEAGLTTVLVEVDEGEASKDLSVAGRLLGYLADHEATREDLVVSFGGGVICDLAGFVASIYHRGMPVVHVPTSLLAQVDAAIGGKTAVNLAHGKNLVGTIHQPRAVICDPSLLRSLPEEELRAGMAEVIKMALITGVRAVESVLGKMDATLKRDEGALTTIVRQAVTAKAAVVVADEKDLGVREILNYGHTFGHAIEHVTHIRHGEAVSVGMMAAAYLAADLEMLDRDGVEVHKRLLEAAGLPMTAAFDVTTVHGALGRDKKNRAEARFVLLSAIGSPQRGVSAPSDLVIRALSKVAA